MATLVACAAFFAGMSLAAGAAAGAEAPECASTPLTTDPIPLERPELWSYAYTLAWCVEEGEIVWIEPRVTHEVHAATCVWVGSMEESMRPEPDGNAWTMFNMSEFSCVTGDDARPQAENPWVIVTLYPDGRYTVVGKDIAIQP